MFRIIMAILATGMAVLASIAWADDKPTKTDREALVGTWSVLEFLDDGSDKLGRLTGPGVKSTDKPEKLPRLVFTTDECYLLRPRKDAKGVRDVLAGLTNVAWKSCVLDGKAKTIDITAADKEGVAKNVVYFGVYEIEGDKLRICWNESGRADAKRPKELKSDGDMNLLVCMRLSETPEKPAE